MTKLKSLHSAVSDSYTRRTVVKSLGALPFMSAFALAGCDRTGVMKDGAVAASTVSQGTYSGPWAVGGTDLITSAYPPTSIFETGRTCSIALTERTTEGPCYFQDSTGEDISEGREGLPMQLCLQLIDENCQPLANHKIEVWHCDSEGIYSADTSNSEYSRRFNEGFCSGDKESALSSTWFRGQLMTDSDGRVNFKTCFPGWYQGRTIHIHFSVTDSNGNASVTSQFCFQDGLAKEICTQHPNYMARGEQGTPLSSGRDTVFPRSGFEAFMLTTRLNDDGTLLSYGSIQIS
ncbi:hypothetical protein ACFQ45_04800 [Rhodanobacter aciditrophus]|uniref:Intradiol ring-cleavage dioxygenases domain-containing protein n=1 Tax=Rhodanobacter aciditrophus TaxID=1623218 RepID=A0ABW4AZI6_9GAMM